MKDSQLILNLYNNHFLFFTGFYPIIFPNHSEFFRLFQNENVKNLPFVFNIMKKKEVPKSFNSLNK